MHAEASAATGRRTVAHDVRRIARRKIWPPSSGIIVGTGEKSP
jgi:hypothetical protein